MRIFQPTISGSTSTTGSLIITGSIRVSEGVTGSLFGTSSWATNAITASFLPVGTYNITSSWATNAITTSFTPNALTTASVSSNTITFTKGDGSTFPITVNTGSGGGGVTINNNTDNYIVTATGTANTLNGESGLTYDGITLNVSGNITTDTYRIKHDPTTTAGYYDKGAIIASSWGDISGPALTAGQIVYYNTAGEWVQAQANATGSSAVPLGVVTNVADQREILLQGTITISGSALQGTTRGQVIYLSPTVAGQITVTPPTASGQIARILGYVITPNVNVMYFNPDYTWIQL